MPSVKLYYGPYKKHGVIRHKTQRLHGVIQCLTKLKYKLELIPTQDLDTVVIKMKGKEIFRCNILNLLFNIDCEDDPVCKKLVAAVQDAKEMLYSKDDIPNYGSISRGKRVIQEIKQAKTAQDLLSSNIKLWYEIPLYSPTDNLKKGENKVDDV